MRGKLECQVGHWIWVHTEEAVSHLPLWFLLHLSLIFNAHRAVEDIFCWSGGKDLNNYVHEDIVCMSGWYVFFLFEEQFVEVLYGTFGNMSGEPLYSCFRGTDIFSRKHRVYSSPRSYLHVISSLTCMLALLIFPWMNGLAPIRGLYLYLLPSLTFCLRTLSYQLSPVSYTISFSPLTGSVYLVIVRSLSMIFSLAIVSFFRSPFTGIFLKEFSRPLFSLHAVWNILLFL